MSPIFGSRSNLNLLTGILLILGTSSCEEPELVEPAPAPSEIAETIQDATPAETPAPAASESSSPAGETTVIANPPSAAPVVAETPASSEVAPQEALEYRFTAGFREHDRAHYRITDLAASERQKVESVSRLTSVLGKPVDIKKSNGTGGPLEAPLPVEFDYSQDPAAVALIEQDPSRIYVARFDPEHQAWLRLPSSYDRDRKVLTGFTDHLSVFAPRMPSPLRAQLEQEIRDAFNQLERERPSAGLVGELIVVDGEIVSLDVLSGLTENERLFQPKFWGCFSNPSYGPIEVSAPISKAVRLAGTEVQIVIDANASFMLDPIPSADIRGIATDQNGDPIKNARITAQDQRTGRSYETKTDKQGRYQLKVHSSDLYEVSFDHKDCDDRESGLEVCGWGPVLGSGARIQEVKWDVSSRCKQKGDAAFEGTLGWSGTLTSPDVQTTTNYNIVVAISLEKTQDDPSGIYWAGEWEGTLSAQLIGGTLQGTYTNSPCTLSMAFNGMGPSQRKIKLRLNYDPQTGGVATTSSVTFEQASLAGVTGNTTLSCPGGGFSSASAAPGNIGDQIGPQAEFTLGSDAILLSASEENQVSIRFQEVPLFDQIETYSNGGLTVTQSYSNLAEITIRKIEQE